MVLFSIHIKFDLGLNFLSFLLEEEKLDTTDAPVTSLPVSSAVPTASSGLDVHTITSTRTLNYRSDFVHCLSSPLEANLGSWGWELGEMWMATGGKGVGTGREGDGNWGKGGGNWERWGWQLGERGWELGEKGWELGEVEGNWEGTGRKGEGTWRDGDGN